ncbi:MAG: aminotransferase class V-fold PLP-dependent enzyme [Candidatus Aminicenantes bacterium]|nr:aminotransferase class V-fold PLP-dependent enzyme [Candidatus Aminicenantes bacterium]
MFQAMAPFLQETFGNPQSLHSFGQEAQAAVEDARQSVARLIGASSEEIYFTASGSEANNFALKGLALANRERGTHIVVSAVEHQSVLQAAKSLERLGFRSTQVPVDAAGRVDPEAVGRALTKDTGLVSIMTANSEVGTVEPVAEIAKVCRSRSVLFHTDAVAAAGSIPLDVKALGIDSLSLAGDPMYGPKGSAALFVRKGARILPLVDGGIQESGRRAGTENVAAIVGLGRAADLARTEMDERAARGRVRRAYLIDSLPRKVEHVVLTGHRTERLPHQASFCVRFIEGEGMLLSLDLKGIAVASGSACTSRALKASHVLLAMGLDHALAQGSIVFGLIDSTTRADIDYVLEVFPPIVQRLRDMSPLYTQFLQEKK